MNRLPIHVLPGFTLVTDGMVKVGDRIPMTHPREWIAVSTSDVGCPVNAYRAIIRKLPNSTPTADADFGEVYPEDF